MKTSTPSSTKRATIIVMGHVQRVGYRDPIMETEGIDRMKMNGLVRSNEFMGSTVPHWTTRGTDGKKVNADTHES